MDLDTAIGLVAVSTTILHAWIIYVTYFWFANNCVCV